MKKLIMILLIAGWGHAFAQKTKPGYLEAKEHISKQFPVQKASATVFALHNIWGNVKIEGYNGDKILIEIDQTISARDAAEMDRAKKEFQLGFDIKPDSIIAYTAEPYDTRPRHSRSGNNESEKRYYTVRLDYVVKVPNNINLNAGTVNDGYVDIKDVYGILKVNNVNGAVSIANAKGTTTARTINGNLTINYLSIPTESSSYYTLNGKLEATFPANLSANVQFKSMNGGVYTDFEDTETLPTEVVKSQSKNNQGTTYKLNKASGVKVGKGGQVLKFETLNGNIYLKKA
ncbi:DUF4097 family beta strand repeat-containing protein [Mucilaginibacter myungsuensis]|uniref:DUF4097 domain-containing protein n=1 Tax=Mucilaginibacter myungsuensis TaxID=649104 RepID=A0A929KYY7_9SPHI|nr:DUF4097 family beta strand repeat-containing protein [Mucilaginibacter myungsuensis]MBE9664271.1 hypothetical protein [Mucilaginibacter myungsuensis]MDN3599975.1 DUF4097 family beta strand repeat-containing protein [Mucilaginibacter myungsuensis]